MAMKFTVNFGKPVCVVLYAIFAALAVKYTFIPLAALFVMHLVEYIVIGRKVAKEHKIGILPGIANCICFGFTWWLPIKNNMA